jgi:D-3-phosphoglycerate dehydrogenase / 2-oxoglutarate reductase
MKTYKVVITDNVFPSLDLERLRLDSIGAFLLESPSNHEEDIISVAKSADAILVGYAPITSKIINSLRKCKIIARYGIGVDNIDIKAANQKGIPITNVPDYCVDEVSNHAFALLLALARKIVNLDGTVKKGVWSYDDHRPIYRLYGKVLGLIGFGKIARDLVKKVKHFGFDILVYDPYVSFEISKEYDVKFVSKKEILKESDFISLHLPLTPKTKCIISKKELKKMKKTAYLINTSRGRLVDEKALSIALEEKWIAGAALDVLSNEKEINSNHPLVKLNNIILTPHMAFYSEESIKDLRIKAVDEVIRALMGDTLHYCINQKIQKPLL